MNRKHVQWLVGELPGLVNDGVISEEGANRIREHYGPVTLRSPGALILTLCSILGALLIGSGLILLLAYNWSDLGRSLRAGVSFMPLVLGQGLVGWTLLRKESSSAWREGSGAFLAMGIGASIALIGQTYHIPGDAANFLLTWVLLALPLVYLLQSTSVAVLYLVGATAWTLFAQEQGRHGLWYWPLLAAIMPYMVQLHRKHRSAPRTGLVVWVLCLCLTVVMGATLEKVLPGLWIVAYASLFSVYCLIGRAWYRHIPGQPLTVVGCFGTVILSLVLTFNHGWRAIGYRHYRGGDNRYLEWFGIQDYVVVMLLLGGVVLLSLHCLRQKDYQALLWSVAPLVAVIGYALVTIGGTEMPVTLLFNLFLFALGLVVLRRGMIGERLLVANGGMGILALLFTVRFFDGSMGILLRAVAFIGIGVLFLGANFWMSRKQSKTTELSS